MKLEDVIPQDSKIIIGGKEYELRKMNLEDEAWMARVIGEGDELQKVFQEMQFDKISKLIFRLLKNKQDFLPMKIEDHDDDGYPVERFVTGPQRVLRSTHGTKEKIEMYYSVMETIGVSRPMLDKLEEQEIAKEEKKRKEEEAKTGVKKKLRKQTGHTSLTK